MSYNAYISYSHDADTRAAEAIQAGLQKFAKPWYRRRALSIFRDPTGLAANPGLWPSIVDAMAGSDYLIVLCSPYAAASPWVGREIHQWVATKPKGRILPVLVAGELEWSDALGGFDPARSSAAHPVLAQAFTEAPSYVDMRGVANEERVSLPKFREGIAQLAAPLHSLASEALVGEDVRQRRRTLRVAWVAALVVFLLGIAAVVGAVATVNKADEARRAAEAKIHTQNQGDVDARTRELQNVKFELASQKSKLDDAQNEMAAARKEATHARHAKARADVLRKKADAAATDANHKADAAAKTATQAEARAATLRVQQHVAERARAIAKAAQEDAERAKLAAQSLTADAVRRQGSAQDKEVGPATWAWRCRTRSHTRRERSQ